MMNNSFIGGVSVLRCIEMPKNNDVNSWAEYFRELKHCDCYAPFNLCMAILAGNIHVCLPDDSHKQYYYELAGVVLHEANIFDSAMCSGIIGQGISDIVDAVAGDIPPEHREAYLAAIWKLFERIPKEMVNLTDKQFIHALRFAYARRSV